MGAGGGGAGDDPLSNMVIFEQQLATIAVQLYKWDANRSSLYNNVGRIGVVFMWSLNVLFQEQ